MNEDKKQVSIFERNNGAEKCKSRMLQIRETSKRDEQNYCSENS